MDLLGKGLKKLLKGGKIDENIDLEIYGQKKKDEETNVEWTSYDPKSIDDVVQLSEEDINKLGEKDITDEVIIHEESKSN